MEFKSVAQLSWSSEVECNPKMSISFFGAGEELWTGFKTITQARQSLEAECNPKMNIA